MLPKKLRILLIFFDVFGFNSGSSNLSRRYKITNSICILHVLLVVIFTLYKIRLILKLHSTLPLIDLINSVFQYSVLLYFYWFIVVDSIFYKREHRIFWEIFQKISKTYSNQCNLNLGHFILKFVVYVFTTAWCLIAVTVLVDKMYEFVYFYVILMKICEVRVFYYIFCLEVLNSQMEKINRKLNENKNKNRFWLNSKRFQEIRQYYSCVYEMTNCLNKVFGLSQAAGISFCFYMVLTDFNWISTHFNELNLVFAICKY